MKPPRGRPEDTIRNKIKKFLEYRGWYVKIIHGGKYQSGLPDLYATHKAHGPRWIEVKLPDMKGSKFTEMQLEVFPKLSMNGTPIWILTDASQEEYKKLFEPENLAEYLVRKA